jgi:hypothetical protein
MSYRIPAYREFDVAFFDDRLLPPVELLPELLLDPLPLPAEESELLPSPLFSLFPPPEVSEPLRLVEPAVPPSFDLVSDAEPVDESVEEPSCDPPLWVPPLRDDPLCDDSLCDDSLSFHCERPLDPDPSFSRLLTLSSFRTSRTPRTDSMASSIIRFSRRPPTLPVRTTSPLRTVISTSLGLMKLW